MTPMTELESATTGRQRIVTRVLLEHFGERYNYPTVHARAAEAVLSALAEDEPAQPAALTLSQQIRLEAAGIFGGHVGYTTLADLITGTLALARAIGTGEHADTT